MSSASRTRACRLAVLLALLAAPAWAAPTFDGETPLNETFSNVMSGTLASSKTTAGSNRIAVASFMGQVFSSMTGLAPTYCGNAMTKLGDQLVTGQPVFASVWYYKAPPTTGCTVAFDMGGQTFYGTVIVTSYKDVDQTTPWGSVTTVESASEASTTVSVTPSSASGELVVASMSEYAEVPTISAGTEAASNNVLGTTYASVAYRDGATPTVSWTLTGSPGAITAKIAASLKPAAGGGGGPVAGSFTLGGVGK